MILEEMLKLLSDTLWQIKNSKDLSNFLVDLLTPQEIEEFGTRLKLLKMLKEGLTQREISKQLGISITTVSRGARILNYGTGAMKKINI